MIPAPDDAGWHGGGKLEAPEGVRLVFRPPYSPGPQPAERPRPSAREAVVGRRFASLAGLDSALAGRRLALADRPDLIEAHTRFHRWPEAP